MVSWEGGWGDSNKCFNPEIRPVRDGGVFTLATGRPERMCGTGMPIPYGTKLSPGDALTMVQAV